jgi:hypothetical protein
MPFHDHSAMGHDAIGAVPGLGIGGLMLALFLAGLTGGFTHCAGMCGSFVLAQVGGVLCRVPAAGFGRWMRLRSAALLPYHAGRLTTYVGLGMAAGGLTGAFVEFTQFKAILSVFLLVAAGLFFTQLVVEMLPSLRSAGGRGLAPLANGLSRIAAPLFADPTGWRGYTLGVALGFLPCGLLYSALAAAAGSGAWIDGGLAMGAFVAGTAPALVAVGYGGAAFGRRWQPALRPVARSLMAANAALLVWMAVETLS